MPIVPIMVFVTPPQECVIVLIHGYLVMGTDLQVHGVIVVIGMIPTTHYPPVQVHRHVSIMVFVLDLPTFNVYVRMVVVDPTVVL
jgi:hypothetical protein